MKNVNYPKYYISSKIFRAESLKENYKLQKYR